MTETLTTLLIITGIAYTAEVLFLYIGLRQTKKIAPQIDYEPTVSIIVAARNEEQSIEQCLLSLVNTEYPKDKLQIVVVNDRSTDSTLEIVQQVARHNPTITYYSTSDDVGNLKGKANALALGIENSSGEILMFTDADCVVPTTWVRETVRCFDDNTGIVGGFTLLEAARKFEGMQALDWIYLFGIASSTAWWGIPLTATGNNLSVRRSAYEQAGGYKNIPFSVTEDYMLVQAILQKTNLKLKYPMKATTLVKSSPCQTWNQLYHQKQRWGVGGLDMVTRGFFIMAIGWLFKSTLILSLFFSHFSICSIAVICKSLVDFLFLYKPLKKFGKIHYLKYFPYFELYFTIYVVVLPFVAMFSKKVVWKERTL